MFSQPGCLSSLSCPYAHLLLRPKMLTSWPSWYSTHALSSLSLEPCLLTLCPLSVLDKHFLNIQICIQMPPYQRAFPIFKIAAPFPSKHSDTVELALFNRSFMFLYSLPHNTIRFTRAGSFLCPWKRKDLALPERCHTVPTAGLCLSPGGCLFPATLCSALYLARIRDKMNELPGSWYMPSVGPSLFLQCDFLGSHLTRDTLLGGDCYVEQSVLFFV